MIRWQSVNLFCRLISLKIPCQIPFAFGAITEYYFEYNLILLLNIFLVGNFFSLKCLQSMNDDDVTSVNNLRI